MAEKETGPAVRILDRAAILAADDREIERVPVPEWGGFVFVRSLTGAERDQFESDSIRYNRRGAPSGANLANARARMAVLAVCDEAGAPVFSAADIGRLSEKSSKPLDRIFDVASRLSGMSEADIAEIAEGF